MKKMLAVCAACMVAGLASADVTSDNVVGFTTTTTVENFNWVAPTFNTIGADTISIKDLTISDGGQGMVGWGTEILQTLDDGGAVADEYYYYDPSMDVTGTQTGYYWADAAGTAVSATLAPGAGRLLYTAAADLVITFVKPYSL